MMPQYDDDCAHMVCPGQLVVVVGPKKGTYACGCACHFNFDEVVCPLDGKPCSLCEPNDCESAVEEDE